jgi:flagellar biosynthesis/type III secretory pathway M-ring protein FliF/YscJ
VVGTAPNVEGESRPSPTSPLKGSKTREEANNKYVVGKKTVTQEDEVGRIKGMTVSILLPFKTTQKPKLDAQGKPTKETETVSEEYPAAEQQRFRELVLNSIGFNSAKDIAAKLESAANLDGRFTVAVQSMELYQSKDAEIAQAGISLPLTAVPWADAAGYVVAGIVALSVLFIARGQLKRSHQAWAEAEARSRAVADEEAKKNAPPEVQETQEDKEKQALKQKRTELKTSIQKKILEDPNTAAQIVKKWLYEN